MHQLSHGRVLAAALFIAISFGGTLRAQVIPPGYDLLETDSATTFDNLTFQPGALLPYCDGGFSGPVNFRGSPIDCFGTVCDLSPTDTIVQRLAAAPPPSMTIPIQIVALELRSVQPITVNCTGGPQDWNVSASVPPNDPAQTPGSMTINHNHPRGGTFTSTLPVRPQVTFTRVSDNSTVGPMPTPSILFQVSAPTPWCRRPNPVDDPMGDVVVRYDASTAFFPGIICPSSPGGAGKRKKVLTVEQAAQAAHGILPAEKKHHYKCFNIVGPQLNIPVTLQDQFGTQQAQVLDPRFLCPPARKNHQFGSLDSPHLKCYRIQPFGPPPQVVVDLNGQFGYEKNVAVGPADMLCTPANKTVISPNPTPPPVGPPPATPHYTCYPIAGTPPPPTNVTLETQFGLQQDFVGLPRYLCTPTIKTVNNVSYGNLNEPHLKCYDITPPHDPPHIVNLQTQFGLEPNLPVGPSRMVCIPVNKRPTECGPMTPTLPKGSFVAPTVPFTGALYHAYKGDLQLLSAGYGSCLATNLASPSFADAAIPLLGRGFFYLITASIPSHDGPVESTLGYRSSGDERANTDSCSP